MRISIVIGLGFGDEGKGLVTSALASLNPEKSLVVRFGGGHQCGHTVILKNGIRHVFSNFGSGTLQGVPTYWSRFCTFDPIGIKNEYRDLVRKGFKPKLYIDPRAMVVTPFDIISNRLAEEELGEERHGSVGVGFGATIARNKAGYELLAIDILTPSVFLVRLDMINKKYYNKHLLSVRIYNEYIEAVQFIRDCEDIQIELFQEFYSFEHMIFEGHQGVMLDQKVGFFPHVTRSYTTVRNAYKFIDEIGIETFPDIYCVTRSYLTRHGAGPLPNEGMDINLINNENETNIKHNYQGEFRIAPLDIDLLNYAYSCNDTFVLCNLVVTCMDQLKNSLSYTINGKINKFEGNYEKFFKDNFVFANNIFLSYSSYTEDLNIN